MGAPKRTRARDQRLREKERQEIRSRAAGNEQERQTRVDEAGRQAPSSAGRNDGSSTQEETRVQQPSSHELPPRNREKVNTRKVDLRKLAEIGELLHYPSWLSYEEQQVRLHRALELYESLDPQDCVEGMLANQMVGTHYAALDCLRRAAQDGGTGEQRDASLKQAHKLMSLFVQQMSALDKHRGKGQQKVTVEHVYVAAGGQAFVGNVEARPDPEGSQPNPGNSVSPGATPQANTKALAHNPSSPMPEIRVRERSRRSDD